jgi:hydrogenase-4 component F
VTDLAVASPVVLALLTALALPFAGARRADRVSVAASCLTAAAALVLSAVAAVRHDDPLHGSWYALDAAGGVFLAVIAVVGLLSALVSPAHLRASGSAFFGTRAPRRSYYVALHLFWAALLAVPLVDNLAVAWIVIEATTAVSALLVASGGTPRALEAGWKYLVLTTLGLAVALLGILVLYAAMGDVASSLGALDYGAIRAAAPALDHDGALLALVLVLGGMAAKIGWAPVHNWLPDAHSEAPAPVSALLSAALLPTVMLVAWRVQVALAPATGGAATTLFCGFGLASLAIAVPFLWRRLPVKRLLAYSSLEHMGILALGIGFAHPLATAGVVVHVTGHALAKSLGFYATIPQGAPGRVRSAALGLSLGSLSGMPPAPLFVSELLIVAGGVAAGHTAVAIAAVALLALGFLGLAHALIEGTAGGRVAEGTGPPRPLAALTAAVAAAQLALAAGAFWLIDSPLVSDLMRSVA